MTQLNISQMARDIEELKRGGGGGTSNYNELTNRPTFNGSTIAGDITDAVENYLVDDSSAIDTLHGAITAEHDRITTTKQDVETNAYNIEMLTGDVEDNTTNINSLDGRVTALEESGGASHTYSTEEQEVGTWIDGRKVYEKTIVASTNTRPIEQVLTTDNIQLIYSNVILSSASLEIMGNNQISGINPATATTGIVYKDNGTTYLYADMGTTYAPSGYTARATYRYLKAV